MKLKRLSGVLLLAAFILANVGCATYRVRAVVVRLPDEASPTLVVLHEAIRNFRGASGARTTMEVMMMGFSVSHRVSLAGYQPEDKVKLVLRTDWSRNPGIWVHRIKHLKASTELELDGFLIERTE